MATAVNMPQVGQDLETAVITEWKVREGDTVKVGDIIALVESDKAVFEVEVFETGTILKLLYEEGDEAKVLEPIAIIGSHGESLDLEKEAWNPEKTEPEKGAEREGPQAEDNIPDASPGFHASPSARRFARQHDVALAGISGSGPGGRIVKEDILRVIGEKKTGEKGPVSGPASEPPDLDQIIPFSKIRQTIADRMTRSVTTIPHFYLFIEVDLTDALAWRESFNAGSSWKVSINDLIVKASAQALATHPVMNAHVEPHQLVVKKDINIGIAVSVEDGLIVPVLARADKMNIIEISKASKEVTKQAREGVMKTSSPGTFTISNLGMFSVSRFLPIINPPEAAILGVGSTEKKMVPASGNAFTIRDRLNLALACDHRAVDGVLAAEFLHSLKQQLEVYYDK
jgi:pyruvate dehydrogenase E2 component (dihydrolipoamide acetyltransferase)